MLRLIACPYCLCRQKVSDSATTYQCLNCKKTFDPSALPKETRVEGEDRISFEEAEKLYTEFKVEKIPYKPQPMISYLLKVIPTALAVIVLLWAGDKGGFFVYIAIAGWVAAWIINMHEQAKVDRYNQAQLDKREELRKQFYEAYQRRCDVLYGNKKQ